MDVLITRDDPEYPGRFREIYDPPQPLYVHGNIELLNHHAISVVGARRPTPHGNQMARRISKDLAERGANRIIVGMALGVVIGEGAQYSGSLITTRLPMGCGREVAGT
ncbi:MAG TPA: DNA-processing protein DprA [Candidatus Acidoferrales bacterium]|nr:DNA-processing protein DprA [Candidatus Acidoferrales bacterium]